VNHGYTDRGGEAPTVAASGLTASNPLLAWISPTNQHTPLYATNDGARTWRPVHLPFP